MNAEESFKKYPYYIYPAIEALDGTEGEERQKLLRRIACGVGPTSALRTLIGVDPEEFRDFYGELQQPDLSTSETIDLFLDKFADNQVSENIPVEVPIVSPAIDYAASLAGDNENFDDMPDDDTSSLLTSFLGGASQSTAPKSPKQGEDKDEVKEGAKSDTRPDVITKPGENTEPLSEALVKIMIKNGNYRKALEIITEINLKNPKKSVYFADQIRFLEKLTLLQEGSKE